MRCSDEVLSVLCLRLMKRYGPLIESDAAYVFKQVCHGVKHLHEKGSESQGNRA